MTALARRIRLPDRARLSVVTCALLALGACAVATADEVAPDVHLLRANVIAALGGEPRLAGFKSLSASGTMVGVSGFPGTYQMWATAPANRIVTWDIGYLKQTTAVADQSGWERVAAVRELAGDELTRARHEARFTPFAARLRSGERFTVALEECAGKPVYMLRFAATDVPPERVGVDRQSFLPICAARTENYEEGSAEVTYTYGDYRRVHGLMLPYVLNESHPDGSLEIHVNRYVVNERIAPQLFEYPHAEHFADPISVELSTLPVHIYKEDDGNYSVGAQRFWGMYFYQSASWSFDVVVKERYGRYLEPLHARIDLYSGAEKLASQEWSRSMLLKMRRSPVARFTPQGEIYGFRHNLSVPQSALVDKVVYTLDARSADGQLQSTTLAVPIETYRPKAQLIFPMKGKFLVTSGHESYELEHKYERSQQFAIDIVALGDDFEFARNDGAAMEDYVGYARRQILSPAAGVVAYARNDIPDGAVKSDFLKMKDGLQAIAGNLVIIDHGTGEFSIFCHMHHGSVTVRTGDRVTQGQVIGFLGAAGSPGLPHLHYQLQTGPHIFGDDGLPLVFENIERIGWLGRSASGDEHGPAPVEQPRSGVYMLAK